MITALSSLTITLEARKKTVMITVLSETVYSYLRGLESQARIKTLSQLTASLGARMTDYDHSIVTAYNYLRGKKVKL